MKKIFLLSFLAISTTCFCQIDLPYQTPHENILELADAPLPPLLSLNDEATIGLLRYRSNFKSIQELSQDELRLAGLRINPKTNISSRKRYFIKLDILDVESGQTIAISGLPKDGSFSNISWSPDESKIACTNTEENGVSLWVIDVQNKSAKKLTEARLNANMRSTYSWMKDNSSILVKMLPQNKATLIDAENAIPTGPTISVNEGKKAQNRTYQDLLKNKTDEQNFETLVLSEIWKVNVESGQAEKWKDSNMYNSISLSPDGNFILLTTIKRPFSYLVPYNRFPTSYDMYDLSGKLVKNIVDVPLIEDLPKGFMATRQGIRNISWREDHPATIVWAEALDEGDPEKEVEYRDAVYQQSAPFTSAKSLLIKTVNRYRFIDWATKEMAICYDYWWPTRNIKSYLFNPSDIKQSVSTIEDRNYQDRYSDPGQFATTKNKFGKDVLYIEDGFMYLIGDGYSDKGIYPFVDKLNLDGMTKERIYEANDTTKLESLYYAIDMKKGTVLSRLESKTEYPNFYLRNIKDRSNKAITQFDNPFKAIQNVHKEIIKYKRDDGIDLSGTLYLPVGYDKDKKEKLPMIMWAYPREFKDKNSANQVTSSSNEFTYPYYGSPVFWVNRGYAVLDDAAFPILGEEDEQPNDSFIKQLVGNGKAGIDAVDKLGYIDRNKVAVGGHSYGAFMTANLLSHSDLFAAGIARSGAYNRTLTPFGFQAEERTYWEAPEIYYNMSPFMHADKMKTPLLLIHGEADNNSGTYPMQSERYFNALKGLGAIVRLVMLPKESHGYSARESVMHILWEQDQWLEKHVKNRVMEKMEE